MMAQLTELGGLGADDAPGILCSEIVQFHERGFRKVQLVQVGFDQHVSLGGLLAEDGLPALAVLFQFHDSGGADRHD